MDWLTAAGLGLGVYLLLKPKSEAATKVGPAAALPPAQPSPYGPQYTPDPSVDPQAPVAPGLAPPTGAQLAGVAQYIRDYYNLPLLQTVDVSYNASDDTLTIAYGGGSGSVEWSSTHAKLFDPNSCEERDPPFFGPCKYSQAGGF